VVFLGLAWWALSLLLRAIPTLLIVVFLIVPIASGAT
jgi:hypothetical protein